MKITFGGKLERPNVCFLCETTPEIGSKVIDTERYFEGHPFNLQGRRYVCEKCVNGMVPYFDLAPLAQVEQAKLEQSRAEAMLRGLKLRLDQLHKDLTKIAESPNLLMEEVVEPELEGPDLGVGEELAVDAGSSSPDEGAVEAFSSEGTSSAFRPQESLSGESEAHFSAYS